MRLVVAHQIMSNHVNPGYGIAMTAFNDGAWEACLDLLVRSLLASVHPNVVSCTTLIRTCATAGEWRTAGCVAGCLRSAVTTQA